MSANADTLDLQMMVDANPRYCPLTSSTILVENTAENIIYRKEPVKSKASDSLSFTLDVADQFIGRDMYITWDKIPLTVTRSAEAASVATKKDFHSVFFDNYETLTMKQYGLLNAISTIAITVDGKNISSYSVADIMESIGHFYDQSELQRHIDCSSRNVYYSNLVPETNPWIPTYTTTGEQTIIKGSSLSHNDPVSAAVSDGYNSRTPLFTLIETPTSKATKTQVNVNLHGVSTWLPFNILGINGDVTPLYHAKSIQITITLHSNWVSRIFQTKRNIGLTTSPFNFAINRSEWGTNAIGDISINFKMYRPPQYIQKTLDSSRDKYIQSLSIVEQDTRVNDITFKSTEKERAITSTPFDLRAIPKSIIVSLVNKRTTDDQYLTDATHFCRLDNLQIELNGTKTDLANGHSSEQLYYISKANGLEMNKQQALYTLGFPVYLDTTSNLGCSTNSYIGLSTAESSGKYTLRVTCSATRLHHDTEAADFKTTATNIFNRKEKIYELRVIVVYAGFFTYNLMGSKFNTIESLSRSELDSLSTHTNALFHSFAPKMNIIGGSWISSLLPKLKGVASGTFNVIKAIVSNKDGLRDALVKNYKGETTGGAFDNHAPLLGGQGYGHVQSNISAGKPIKGWESL